MMSTDERLFIRTGRDAFWKKKYGAIVPQYVFDLPFKVKIPSRKKWIERELSGDEKRNVEYDSN